MLPIPEEKMNIASHDFSSDTEMEKMTDNSFLSQATKSSTVTFTVIVNGSTDFVFVNTQAESIQISIKNDNNETLYDETKMMKAIAAESCEEIFATEPVWIDECWFQLCDEHTGTATITVTPRDGEVKIGKFVYGTPASIGAMEINTEYNYEDFLKLNDDESVSSVMWIKPQYIKFVRPVLQKYINKNLIWIDPFSETFLWGKLESYKLRNKEEAGKTVHLIPIEQKIKGII